MESHVHATFPLAQSADAMAVLSSRGAMGKVILHR
jgi:NADPH2:quinone reductase